MLKIKFNCLADAFCAVFFAFKGEKVSLEVPENLLFITDDVRLTRFVDDRVFRSDNNSDNSEKAMWIGETLVEEKFSDLQDALENLHIMSPNTVYTEKIYAAVRKNAFRDFANHFRGKAYREISSADNAQICADGISLNSGFTLKLAPAYRCNYSRLAISLIKTLKDLGGTYSFCSGLDFDRTNWTANMDPDFTLSQYKLDKSVSPLKTNTLYIPNGIFLFHRGNDFYITSESTAVLDCFLPTVLEGMKIEPDKAREHFSMDFYKGDLPLEAFVMAKRHVMKELKLKDLDDLKNLRLNGSNFEFSPSMADVIGYADYNFDMVKRQGIDVSIFKNAVFDYGTHIEDIVNTTFDLYPEYHNGQKAFDEAIMRYRASELN